MGYASHPTIELPAYVNHYTTDPLETLDTNKVNANVDKKMTEM